MNLYRMKCDIDEFLLRRWVKDAPCNKPESCYSTPLGTVPFQGGLTVPREGYHPKFSMVSPSFNTRNKPTFRTRNLEIIVHTFNFATSRIASIASLRFNLSRLPTSPKKCAFVKPLIYFLQLIDYLLARVKW